MANGDSVGNYDDSFGVLPTLVLYEQKRGRAQTVRTFNWTMYAVNGEPLARGCGETNGGFKSMPIAWRNARLSGFAFGGDRLPEATPRPGANLAAFDPETGEPVLRIQRGWVTRSGHSRRWP
jgi:ornithine cyclodeaminase/alanine dehydrogenase-like protein (mu-crystallin family)